MLKIITRSKGFSLTPALSAYVNDHVSNTLEHRREALHRVDVRVDDINGPRGGFDKRCSVVVRLHGGRTVTAQRRHQDLYVAVREAIDIVGLRVDASADRARAARRAVVR